MSVTNHGSFLFFLSAKWHHISLETDEKRFHEYLSLKKCCFITVKEVSRKWINRCWEHSKKACWWLCYGLEMYSRHHSFYQIKTKENSGYKSVYCSYPLVLNPLNSYLFMYLFINTPHSANGHVLCPQPRTQSTTENARELKTKQEGTRHEKGNGWRWLSVFHSIHRTKKANMLQGGRHCVWQEKGENHLPFSEHPVGATE